MEQFWTELGLAGQIYFVMACVASVLMIIQLIFLLIGFIGGGLGDVDGSDIDADIDADGGSDVGLISLKGLIAFFAIGGWVGVAMVTADVHLAVTVIVSLACGAVALIGIGFLYKAIYSLQSSGNINVVNAIGQTVEVYLTVPAKDSGTGKVTALVQERQVELEARTNSLEPIKTGSMAKIVSVVGSVVIVEPIGA